jgi:hypothetical protein
MSLTRNDILNADDLIKEKVEVPEWGGDVWVITMTGTGRDRFEESVFDVEKNERKFSNIRAKLVSCTCANEKGRLLFKESDIPALGQKSSKALDRVFAVARRLNGISAADVKDLEKN